MPTTLRSTRTESHHTAGAALRADELGDARAHAEVLRQLLWGALGLLALSLLYNGYQKLSSPLIVRYVEVERETGQMRVVPRSPDGGVYTVRQETIKKELRHFVTVLRRNIDDKAFQQNEWVALFKHVTPTGHKLLYAAATARDPLTIPDPIDVEVRRVLYKSGTTYDVQWQEKRWTDKRTKAEVTSYSGLFTYLERKPLTEEELDANPSGIWLDSWTFAKEF